MVIINETSHGKVFKCSTCHKYHVEYKNINFNFSEEQLEQFIDYLGTFDFEDSIEVNKESPYHRKIMLSVKHLYCNLLFHKHEILELYDLLTHEKHDLKPEDVMFLNGLGIKQYNN